MCFNTLAGILSFSAAKIIDSSSFIAFRFFYYSTEYSVLLLQVSEKVMYVATLYLYPQSEKKGTSYLHTGTQGNRFAANNCIRPADTVVICIRC